MEENKKTTEYEMEVETVEETVEEENSPSQQLPPNVERIGKDRWWLKYLIAAAVLSVFALIVAWVRGAFETSDKQVLLGALSDAFFVPGILTVCVGLIIVGSNGGAFDMLSYGVKALFRLFKKDPLDRKYGGFYEYSKARRQKKRSFWYLVIVGAVFVALGGAMLGFSYAV